MSVFQIVLAIVLPTLAFGQTPVEEIAMNVGVRVSKCELKDQHYKCDIGPITGTNVKVILNDCSTTQDTTLCSGTWSDFQTRDGINFKAGVYVLKTSDANGVTEYSYSASISEPVLETLNVDLANGKITDRVTLSSRPIEVGPDANGVKKSYVSTLQIGPPKP